MIIPTNLHIASDNINDIQNIIHTIPGPVTIMNISLGSKINQKSDLFNNYIYQILPGHFTTTTEQTIVISIDKYSESEIQYMSNIITNVFSSNIHVILCNSYATKPFISEFIPYIISFLQNNNIEPDKFMICNYIKFKNIPNYIESLSVHIPSHIDLLLNNSIYSNTLYEWFGYHTHFHNYIYNYKYYQRYRGGISSLNLLIDTLKTIQYDNNYKLILKNSNVIHFWKYIYNFTFTNNQFNSVYDDLYEQNFIILYI